MMVAKADLFQTLSYKDLARHCKKLKPWLLLLVLFLNSGAMAQGENLPSAEEWVLRSLIAKHKDRLARFGFYEYQEEAWHKVDSFKSSKAVLLVHGLDEVGSIWDDCAPALKQLGYQVLCFQYPNDQDIESSAILFREQLQWSFQKGIQELILVGHSMGGLVIRDALTRPNLVEGDLPKVHHIITIGQTITGKFPDTIPPDFPDTLS
jgi:pimeloyl-ACP methyl ester carboxylesterase